MSRTTNTDANSRTNRRDYDRVSFTTDDNNDINVLESDEYVDDELDDVELGTPQQHQLQHQHVGGDGEGQDATLLSPPVSTATNEGRGGGAIFSRARRLMRPYSRVATTNSNDDVDDDIEGDGNNTEHEKENVGNASRLKEVENVADDDEDDDDKLDGDDEEDEDEGERIHVTILDFAQSKFQIDVSPSWTIARLKEVSSEIHKVPVHLQRLIFHGQMLSDGKTLEESGIKDNGTIIHLFPKPRVVITSSSGNNNTSGVASCSSGNAGGENDGASDAEGGNAGGGGGGGRVPTIVLDADEAERRSQILVLGSPEYIEAQNNVKLFSFMLLIISSIELLNLLAIALGVPQSQDGSMNGGGPGGMNMNEGAGAGIPGMYEEDDDIFPSNNTPDAGDDSYEDLMANITNMTMHSSEPWGGEDFQPNILYQQWGWPNTIDLIISLAGVYTALIGIQASNENTLRLAKIYLNGTFAVGIMWMLFNYFITVTIDEAVEEEHQKRHPNDDYIPDMSDSDIMKSALSVMILPALVWIMCCLRALQFHQLLNDAEIEAQERIRSELERSNPTSSQQPQHGSSDADGTGNNDDSTSRSSLSSRMIQQRRRRRRQRALERSNNNSNHEEELVLQNNSAILT